MTSLSRRERAVDRAQPAGDGRGYWNDENWNPLSPTTGGVGALHAQLHRTNAAYSYLDPAILGRLSRDRRS